MAIVKTLIVKGVARFLTDTYMSTIRSGIWNGSTILVGYGGTGVTSAKGNLYTPVFLSSSGIAACSVEIPHATKDFKINGATYAVFTNSTANAPTIFAPTTLAGTGGYILATNSAKTGLEWVAKPATNVTTTAVVASSASGTSQIAANQSDPYYNLLEGGAVTRSIQFKHGSNMTITSDANGVITFTSSYSNTWRNIRVNNGDTDSVGTATSTKAMNFASSNLDVRYLAAGTGTGLSGNAAFFTIKLDAKDWVGATSENAGTAGYMPGASTSDRLKYLRGDGSWIALAPSISAGTTDTNKVKITVGGETSSEYLVPYASNADKVDGYHETDFFRYRGSMTTDYVDLTTYTADATNYQNPKNGIWTVSRSGHSAGLITFTGAGSSSGLDIYFEYDRGQDFKFRRRIDSNRLSGDWETILTSVNYKSYCTWRNIYVNGTSKVGTSIDSKAINIASSNLNITYLAAGTDTGQSGNANYFTINLEAKNWTGATSSAAGTAGYMPGAASDDRLKFLRGDGTWCAFAAGQGLTLSGTTYTLGNRWTAITQGQKWSRILYVKGETGIVGNSGILTIRCTRNNVVVNTTFMITTSHNSYGQIIQLTSNNYTPVKIRLLVNSAGDFYVELYDTANSIASGTTQSWYCTYISLTNITITTYTTFTDGTTLPDGFTSNNEFTTTTGNNTVAIKNITRSGTTFTATRLNGSTFTFTQQDTNNRRAFYGTCDTAAATADKVVTLSNATGWELIAGIIVGVKFTYSNSASSVTLNINGTGAESISYAGSDYTGTSAHICGYAGRVTYYMYNGTNWVWLGSGYIIDTSYSTMSLDEITTGTATSQRVMTAKIINDWLHTKAHTITGSWTFNTSTEHLLIAVGDKQLSSASPIGKGKGDIHFYTNNSGSGAELTNGNVASITFGTGTSEYTLAGIYVVTSGSYGTKIILGTTDSYAVGVRYNTIIDNKGCVISSGFKKYDSNDTYVLLGGGGHKLVSDFATSGHVHSLSIAADSGTNQLTLAASTKYKLTAGGSTFIFTTPPNTWVANAVGVAGYVAAPTKASNPNQVWMTNADGAPAWRTINISTAATLLAKVTKTLAVSTWTDMAAVSGYTGTYAIQISSGNVYASGVFTACGGTDSVIDEIPLHVADKGTNTWRPYARISAGQLQMTTNELTGTSREYTIKILKLI